jgi:hypothetical protein
MDNSRLFNVTVERSNKDTAWSGEQTEFEYEVDYENQESIRFQLLSPNLFLSFVNSEGMFIAVATSSIANVTIEEIKNEDEN